MAQISIHQTAPECHNAYCHKQTDRQTIVGLSCQSPIILCRCFAHLDAQQPFQPSKTGDAMLQSSSGQGCPSLLDLPSVCEIFKRENFITSHQFECNEIQDSQSFRSTQRNRQILVTTIIASCQTGGANCKAKNWECNCAPCSNVEPPLLMPAQKLL